MGRLNTNANSCPPVRDVSQGMLWETSLLDADEGIRFRGHSIPDLQAKLPRAKAGGEPLPEGLLWLLLTGEVPTAQQAAAVTEDLRARSKMPAQVEKLLKAMPADTHPMTLFSQVRSGQFCAKPIPGSQPRLVKIII